jgi:hypothetical protein
MHPPKMSIFKMATNLELWPKILPHYRYIRFLERSPDRNIVVMAAGPAPGTIFWKSNNVVTFAMRYAVWVVTILKV